MAEHSSNWEDELMDRFVVFQTDQGEEIRGPLLRMTLLLAVFEVHSPTPVVRMSEVLVQFQVVVSRRRLYAGKAMVSNMVSVGGVLICEAKLDEKASRLSIAQLNTPPHYSWPDRFTRFLSEGQHRYRLRPEFKSVITDMQEFLADLQSWLGQIDLEISEKLPYERVQQELEIIRELKAPVINAIDGFIERFEAIAAGLSAEAVPAYRAYLRRHLHPLLLCSPFAYRAFKKPLGYAGDYGLVDMMIRQAADGETLFAKMINVWLLGQLPAAAHRNRVDYLRQKLVAESMRVQSSGQPLRVFNLGCGPAEEVQRFLQDDFISNNANMTLVDFNDETLAGLRRKLEKIKLQQNRRTRIQFVKKSVHQMLKEAARQTKFEPANQYDFVYCAGLFDYLSDQVCKRLVDLFYQMLAPGGLLLITNVSDALNSTRPFRYSMEYILDWHLIYRDGPAVAALKPTNKAEDDAMVITESLGVNVFLEVRKIRNA